MPYNQVAQQVFGTLGTICWSGQLVPQIWKSWREKSVEGLSHWLMFTWGLGAAFLGVYVIVQDLAIALVVQPQLFGLLGLVSWAQCLYYGKKKTALQAFLMWLAMIIFVAAFEVGFVYAVRPSVERGNVAGAYVFGVGTSVLLLLGLMPQYWEIMRFQEVKGISISFITIDTLGGVFSVLSVVFDGKIDVLAIVAYSLVVVADSVVIILAIILNPRANRRRRRQRDLAELEKGPGEQAEMQHERATTILPSPTETRRPSGECENTDEKEKPNKIAEI